jgi:hypothetical protein
MLLFAQEQSVVITGRVTDVVTGEGLAKAVVSIRDQELQTVTDAEGRFEIAGVRPGEIELYVTTVGYGLLRRTLTLEAGRETQVDIQLGQEVTRRSENLTVTTSVFEAVEPAAVGELTLNNTELKNLAGVMIDDPLRSVQALPGVATGDDFNPDFAVRGLGITHLGLYIDGAFLHSPFHTIRDIDDGGGLTILNGDLLEGISLLTGNAPSKFGDRIGGILNLQTREASRDRIYTRGTLTMSGASITSEGPLGRSGKASWLVSARKSYLDYIINRIDEDPDFVLNFQDVQSKLSLDLSDRHRLRFLMIYGTSGLNRDRVLSQLGENSLRNGDATTGLLSLGWTWLPSARGILQTTVYGTRETADNTNRNDQKLFEAKFLDIGARSDVSYRLDGRHTLEGGFLSRRLNQSAQRRRFDFTLNQFRTRSEFEGQGWYHGAYLEDAINVAGRLTLRAGARTEYFGATEEKTVLPRASVRIGLTGRTEVVAAYGQYAQFPDFDQLSGEYRHSSLQAERSMQYSLGLEQSLTERMRVRVEIYNHRLRGGIFSPETEWRVINNQIVAPRPGEVLHNALRGHSRGIELFFQRRSANNLSGWISYAYSKTRLEDSEAGLSFDGDFDQRHTFNAYASYRLAETLNLSAKYRYGSGFPIAGFFIERDHIFFLSESRNQARQPVYSKLDLRVNKAFFFDRWKLTVFAEVVNVLNREHRRYTSLETIQGNTRRVTIDYNSLLPIIPTFGMTVEF